ncbi:MAG: hypothetical protein A2527_12275 [Candidatus Lambdaproteobacteria bacterium RIFOXYD2_FULL_50_16]|uniref:Uncharacterized protein n=1 Tax=Candidatus Lambdaproteobacteria bacterium RIFOXYD2_FULL_50_16 TaxID=1817772 RepID=A0A1F6GDA2_9PROT|nr:MAG: hypothetical protein A2527_12275 [Candidatus Lambdaproteobacteria bacterium RIFOXYD2_FULL_50_16]
MRSGAVKVNQIFFKIEDSILNARTPYLRADLKQTKSVTSWQADFGATSTTASINLNNLVLPSSEIFYLSL